MSGRAWIRIDCRKGEWHMHKVYLFSQPPSGNSSPLFPKHDSNIFSCFYAGGLHQAACASKSCLKTTGWPDMLPPPSSPLRTFSLACSISLTQNKDIHVDKCFGAAPVPVRQRRSQHRQCNRTCPARNGTKNGSSIKPSLCRIERFEDSFAKCIRHRPVFTGP